jgi:cell wall assembly regulator SMI1
MNKIPEQPAESIFTVDAGGNSTITRLEAELSFNRSKGDHDSVADSSLTYGDLRLLQKLAAEPQRWRDVKVELPQEEDVVLIAVMNEAENHGTGEFDKFPEVARGTIYSHPNGVTADTDCGEFSDAEILGWQPLPSPPKGERP